ncbi:hypothetical protein E4T48_01286 [Aureobasidium sp. EXF-10727]|nr:hypothetical protein E4T48_01286 [Aureobasidium sp. EXF-10727]
MSEQQLLEAFSSALGESDNQSTFACGGHISAILDSTNLPEDKKVVIASQVFNQVITTRPVTIRYGAPGQGQTLRLPTDTTKDPAFLGLISTCEPATFGREGRDVYDEQYRKATKLDITDFCTDFCPYETGIIDIVSQLLMPSVKCQVTRLAPEESQEDLPGIKADVELLHAAIEGSTELDTMTVTEIITSRSPIELASVMNMYKSRYQQRLDEVLKQKLRDADLALLDILAEASFSSANRAKPAKNKRNANIQSAGTSMGIRAELYKLNVYSGPSAHVDTPRSETQIGSLVVCLPSEFEGGVPSVSHQGNTVGFDWSASSSIGQTPAIHWAAFYSDCSHEVQEVTAGHRITLTYNLYASRGSGLLAGKKHNLDATRLPLYRPLVDLMRCRTFMSEGGFMAIGLAHAYAHTHALLHRNMPGAIKGADMMLYETLLGLHLRAEFIRVMDLSEECAEIRMNFSDRYDSDDESVFFPSDEDTFYRLGFEPMEVSSNMLEKYDIENGMPGWERLGPVKWVRRPRDSQLEIAYLAVGLKLLLWEALANI